MKITGFQGLRGIAILLIIISHCSYITNAYGNNVFMWAGGLGVSMFIILSGYLTMHSASASEYVELPLLKRLKSKLRKFYPLYIFTLLLAVPLDLSSLLNGNIVKEAAILGIDVMLLQSWIPSSGVYFSYNAVAWYLSITMFFVAISPLVIKILRKMSLKSIWLLLLAIVCFQFLWVLLVGKTAIAHWLVYICPLVRSLDFILGGCVYVIVRNTKISEKRFSYTDMGIFIALLLCTGILILSMSQNSEIYAVACWTIPVCILVACIALGSLRKSFLVRSLFENKVIVWIGNISFELFLTHHLIIRYTRLLFSKANLGDSFLLYVVAIVLSFVVSVVLHAVLQKIFSSKRAT